jgi:tritrans,polycis-undecaprenyl-diphosphate synthase [geranylgeranyl-diphosphate specific]
MENALKFTEENEKKTINLAIGYDGQQEIVDAAKKIALEHKQGKLDLDSLNPQTFHHYLYTENVNPDLIVRTSGAERLSGFLTYQSSYSELAFIDKFWPELTEADLDNAVRDYYHRKRTFGK